MGLAEGEHKRHRGRARRGQAGAVRGLGGGTHGDGAFWGRGCSCSLDGPDVRGPALPGLPRCTPVLSLFPTEPERRFQAAGALTWLSPTPGWVTLGKSLSLSGPSFLLQ